MWGEHLELEDSHNNVDVPAPELKNVSAVRPSSVLAAMYTLRDNDQIASMAEKEEERGLSKGWQDLDSCSIVGTCIGSVGACCILCCSKLKNL